MEKSLQPSSRETINRTRYFFYLAGCSVLVLAIDLFTKYLIQSRFELGESVSVFGDSVRLTYILNRGGAFSVSIGSNAFYIVTSIVVVVLVIYAVWRRLRENMLIDFALAAVIGGAVGNLIDRIRFGAVIDFIDVDIPNIDSLGIQMQRWPVFNVADAAVTVGMMLIIIAVLFFHKGRMFPLPTDTLTDN